MWSGQTSIFYHCGGVWYNKTNMTSQGEYLDAESPEGNYHSQGIHSIMLPPLGCHICTVCNDLQGQTLRFQARGPKRSFDKNQWSKTRFLVIFHTFLGPFQTEKSRGLQLNLGAYAPAPLGKSNTDLPVLLLVPTIAAGC